MDGENLNAKRLMKPRALTALAMLTALQIVLSRFFSFQTWNIKVGFAFVPVMFAGALGGVWGGAIVGGLSDFLGAMLFPSGAYFPGYTATALLSGAIYGALFYEKHGIARIVMAYVITGLLVTVALNTFNIAFQYGYLLVEAQGRTFANVWTKFLAMLPDRLLQAGGMMIVQVAVTYLMLETIGLDRRVKPFVQF